jgi:hypothetical protein
MEAAKQSLSTPAKMGIILGLVYCIFIFCQNQFFYSNPMQFASTKLFCYLLILGGIFYTAYLSKKEMGGYITFQEALKAMLLAIAILELVYLVFSTVYIKFIDPDFFEKLKTSWEQFFIKNNVPRDKMDESLDKFKEARNITAWGLIKSYGFAIIIDAVFAVIFAAIIKKQRTVFEKHIEQ